MRKFDSSFQSALVLALGLGLVALVGCGKSEPASPSTPAVGDAHADHDHAGHADHEGHDDHAGHDHPSEGPHDGGLVELGEEYHLEVVHDEEANTVTAYVLGPKAKIDSPIDATEILVNLSHDGKAEQFTLEAKPQESDPSGKSSKFVSTDAELAQDLDHEDAEAVIVVTINGKQYRGVLHHDHEGH